MTNSKVSETRIGELPILLGVPSGGGPCAAVVVLHDALGVTQDLRDQVAWLSGAGYLAAAPNLLYRGGHVRCLIQVMRAAARGTRGEVFNDIERVRTFLTNHPDSNGAVGAVGFCLGGGLAFALAPHGGYRAVAPNYGAPTERGWQNLAQSCPVVASFGGRDPTLRGVAARTERVLSEHHIPHDVKEYPGVGHGFMNEHDLRERGFIVRALSWVSRTHYDAAAAADARGRIERFFSTHLRPPDEPRPAHRRQPVDETR